MDGSLGDGLYITYNPTVVEWSHGEARERLIIPPGQVTDFSSIPDSGILGWFAKWRGFNKKADYFKRSGKIHDMLYYALKKWGGILDEGMFQFINPVSGQWENVIAYQWNRQQADAIWRRVSIEDGCPVKLADEGYWWLRKFGGWHMMFH